MAENDESQPADESVAAAAAESRQLLRNLHELLSSRPMPAAVTLPHYIRAPGLSQPIVIENPASNRRNGSDSPQRPDVTRAVVENLAGSIMAPTGIRVGPMLNLSPLLHAVGTQPAVNPAADINAARTEVSAAADDAFSLTTRAPEPTYRRRDVLREEQRQAVPQEAYTPSDYTTQPVRSNLGVSSLQGWPTALGGYFAHHPAVASSYIRPADLDAAQLAGSVISCSPLVASDASFSESWRDVVYSLLRGTTKFRTFSRLVWEAPDATSGYLAGVCAALAVLRQQPGLGTDYVRHACDVLRERGSLDLIQQHLSPATLQTRAAAASHAYRLAGIPVTRFELALAEVEPLVTIWRRVQVMLHDASRSSLSLSPNEAGRLVLTSTSGFASAIRGMSAAYVAWDEAVHLPPITPESVVNALQRATPSPPAPSPPSPRTPEVVALPSVRKRRIAHGGELSNADT